MDELKTKKEIFELKDKERYEYLTKNFKALKEVLSNREIQSIMSSLYDLIIYDYDFSGDVFKDVKSYDTKGRGTWFDNHSAILTAMDRVIMEYGQLPDTRQLSKQTKLRPSAIKKHLENFEHIDFMDFERKKLRMASLSYVTFLTKLAYKGDLKAGALLLKYVNEYSKEHDGNKINAKCRIDLGEF